MMDLDFDAVKDDYLLLGATAAIAVGCLLVIADGWLFEGMEGHPLVVLLLIGGTTVFVYLALQRVPRLTPEISASACAMVVGSALIGAEIWFLFSFENLLGAALFLYGAIVLRPHLDQ